jgi:nucleoside phosphorylase
MIDESGFAVWQTWNPLDGEKNPLFFTAAPDLVQAGLACARDFELDEVVGGWDRRPGVRAGKVVTGDVVAATPEKRRQLHDRFSSQACEMEGAAVAQVCHQHGIPWLVVRGVTDTADYIPPSFEEIARKVAPQVARFVASLVGQLDRSRES